MIADVQPSCVEEGTVLYDQANFKTTSRYTTSIPPSWCPYVPLSCVDEEGTGGGVKAPPRPMAVGGGVSAP